MDRQGPLGVKTRISLFRAYVGFGRQRTLVRQGPLIRLAPDAKRGGAGPGRSATGLFRDEMPPVKNSIDF